MKIINSILFLILSVGCANKIQFTLGQKQAFFGETAIFNNQADILWIIDNSSSMQQHQLRLREQIPQLVAQLNQSNVDYHIAVITTDMRSSGTGGRFIGTPAVITRTTANIEQLLSERILVGEAGSNLERGLQSMVTVLSPNYLSYEGRSFFRDGAMLSINVLSDEDDFSGYETQDVVQFLNQLKQSGPGTGQGWLFNFIGVKQNSSLCTTYNDYAGVGTKYMELVAISGGINSSICTVNLAQAVSNIQIKLIQILRDYYLAQEPDIETIVVKIDGQVIPPDEQNGWSYIPEKLIIRFNGSAVPGPYSNVVVDFTPLAPD